MQPQFRLLVIGPAALAKSIERAMPGWEVAVQPQALAGVWHGGTDAFDAAIVSLVLGRAGLRAVQALRQVCPAARIVVSCQPGEEPFAQAALSCGADDYILEPVHRDELAAQFRCTGSGRSVPVNPDAANPGPGAVSVADVLARVESGVQPVLDTFAALVMARFDAVGVTVEIGDRRAALGDINEIDLQQAVVRDGGPVGSILVSLRAPGSAASSDLEMLSELARIVAAASALSQELERWKELAWRDDLTGLHNRRYFENQLRELLSQAREERLRLTLVLFDIDDFKCYNDRYGHDTGDKLIREVAELLVHCSRSHDVVVRFGGDEFAVVLWDAEKPRVPGSKHPTEPAALAERFRRAIGDHSFQCLGPQAPGVVTISGGLASYPWDGTSAEDITRAADAALLSAKATGKNRIMLADGAAGQPTDAER